METKASTIPTRIIRTTPKILQTQARLRIPMILVMTMATMEMMEVMEVMEVMAVMAAMAVGTAVIR